MLSILHFPIKQVHSCVDLSFHFVHLSCNFLSPLFFHLRGSHRDEFFLEVFDLLSVLINCLHNVINLLHCVGICYLRVVWDFVIGCSHSLLEPVHVIFCSSFSTVSWSHVICSISMTPLPTSRFVASVRALDCTSYMTLACSSYRAFVGIYAIIMSISSTSCSGVCVVSGSSLIISCVTVNVSLLWVTNCTISSSCFCAGGLGTAFCCCTVA
jgi:hypothetical protein